MCAETEVFINKKSYASFTNEWKGDWVSIDQLKSNRKVIGRPLTILRVINLSSLLSRIIKGLNLEIGMEFCLHH